MKSKFEFTIDGFQSGETAIASLLARKPHVNQAPLVNAMFEALLEVRAAAAQGGKSLVIEISGHSDLDQTPGRAETERRQAERDSAGKRADSMGAWVQAVLAHRLGLPPDPPVKFGDHVYVTQVTAGALALLIKPTREADSLRNRRVEVSVLGTNVAAIAAHQGKVDTY